MTTMLEKMEQAAREGVTAKLSDDDERHRVCAGAEDWLSIMGTIGILGVRAAYAWLEANGFVIVPGSALAGLKDEPPVSGVAKVNMARPFEKIATGLAEAVEVAAGKRAAARIAGCPEADKVE